MFHGMLVGYRSLAANNECIYSKYKLCAEKYLRLKHLYKEMKEKNKLMEYEMLNLRTELSYIHNIIDEVKEVRIDIRDVRDIGCDTNEDYSNEVNDCYELV